MQNDEIQIHNINNINNNIMSTFKKFSQERTIQKWTFMTQIQTTATTHNPRNKNTNTNNTNSTPNLKYNTIQDIKLRIKQLK